MSEQVEPRLPQVLIPSSRDDQARRSRAIGETWEAVVRAELLRLRRRAARDRRFSRPEERA